MRGSAAIVAMGVALACSQPALADSTDIDPGAGTARELPPYLQCVPYARERSGVQIYGDAHTWWGQAEGKYERGNAPRIGAVMAFRPHGGMRLGHVAAVAGVIDSRTVLLDHANWSPIDGRRGQIERGVTAIDISPANDWSEVRVWYAPLQDLGTTAWPVQGFIYNQREDGRRAALARADHAPPARQSMSDKPSRTFMQAFAGLESPTSRTLARKTAAPARGDAVAAALAKYDR